jgi:hypothetical protein
MFGLRGVFGYLGALDFYAGVFDIFLYPSRDVTASLTDVHSATRAECVVNTRFLCWGLLVFDRSENVLHCSQWFLTAADALFFYSPGSAVCCSLNVRNIRLAYLAYPIFLRRYSCSSRWAWLFGNVLVGVISGS